MHVFNFQGSAIFGVLAFLGTGLALLLAAGALVFLLTRGRRKLALGVAAGVALGIAGYAAVLFAFSASSRDQVLAVGQEKYFCEVDCHLAYSVRDVERRTTLGPPGKEVKAEGAYYVVTFRTRFDEDTITPRRGNFPLEPNARLVAVVDARGRRFARSPEGEQALEASGAGSVPLTRPLRPGESYETRLVFDLPSDVEDPRLLLTEDVWVTHFLIWHENSFLHKKSSFRLEPGRREARLPSRLAKLSPAP